MGDVGAFLWSLIWGRRNGREPDAEQTFREVVFDAVEEEVVLDFVDDGTGYFDLQVGDDMADAVWVRVQVIGYTNRR